MDEGLIFDILDDLSDNLGVSDFYQFLSINDLAHELVYKVVRRVEYYYEVFDHIRLHEKCCAYGECRCIDIYTPIGYACFLGDLDIIKWFHYNHLDVEFSGVEDIESASAGGQLEIIKWLYNNRSIRGDCREAIDNACCNGYIDIAEWLHQNKSGECSRFLIDTVVDYNQLEALKWIHRNCPNAECSKEALQKASSKGHYEVLAFLHQTYPNIKFPGNIYNLPSQKGDLETIKSIHQNFAMARCSEYAILKASNEGYVEIVEWFYQNADMSEYDLSYDTLINCAHFIRNKKLKNRTP